MSEIMPLGEFLQLPVEEAKRVMLELSRNISDQKLACEWSTQANYVRKLRSILGIHKDHSGTVTQVSDIKCEKWPPSFRLRARRQNRANPDKVVQIPLAGVENSEGIGGGKGKGFTFTLEGIFTADELNKRIEVIKSLMATSINSTYALNISLEEIIPGQKPVLQPGLLEPGEMQL